MNKIILQLIFLAGALSLFSCKKDNPQQTATTGTVAFNIGYNFDNSVLKTDTLLYTNAAGYKMSVTTLNYFISGITFFTADGSKTTIPEVHYTSISDSVSNHFTCNVPNGNYVAVKFYIGLDSVHNQTGALPTTAAINNMAWPDMMGGGYHFMKMEGYYLDKGAKYGYAMHLGKNSHLVTLKAIPKAITVGITKASLDLNMNIAEWYKNPYVYDFDIDGNFSMNNDAAMTKITANGTDVFN